MARHPALLRRRPEVARRGLAAVLHLGLGGVLTLKNTKQLQETARTLPLDRLALETDAPYLTPMPHRGRVRRSEPCCLPFVARRLADLRGLPEPEIAAMTTRSAVRLLGLPEDD